MSSHSNCVTNADVNFIRKIWLALKMCDVWLLVFYFFGKKWLNNVEYLCRSQNTWQILTRSTPESTRVYCQPSPVPRSTSFSQSRLHVESLPWRRFSGWLHGPNHVPTMWFHPHLLITIVSGGWVRILDGISSGISSGEPLVTHQTQKFE